jgi:hypothetical protein
MGRGGLGYTPTGGWSASPAGAYNRPLTKLFYFLLPMKNHINASVEPQAIIQMDDCNPLVTGAPPGLVERFSTWKEAWTRRGLCVALNDAHWSALYL